MGSRLAASSTTPAARWAIAFAYALAALAAISCSVLVAMGVRRAASALTGQTPLIDLQIYRDQVRRIAGAHTTLNTRWYYPPFAAVLFMPLGRLSDSLGVLLWLLLQLVLLALLGRACWQVLIGWARVPRAAAVFGLLLGCHPVLYCLSMGQLGLLVTVLTLASLRGTRQLWLAVAVATKIYPVLYATLYVMHGRVRELCKLLIWVAVLSVGVPLLCLGTGATHVLTQRALQVVSLTTGPRFDEDQTVSALSMRLFYARSQFDDVPTALLVHMPELLALVVGLLASVALVAAALWCTRKRAISEPITISATLLAFTLLVKPGWGHYFVMLPYAQAVLLANARTRLGIAACVASVTLSLLPLASSIEPRLLSVLETDGVVTWSALSALLGLCAHRDVTTAAKGIQTPTS